MKITKFGHACLLIEEKDARFLLDPGRYSEVPQDLAKLDAILITHGHQDHLDVDSVVKLLEKSPNARIITNPEVVQILKERGIGAEILSDGEGVTIKSVTISGFGTDHASVHSSMSAGKNVGFLIADRLFYPGDALTVPSTVVEILALPMASPWHKLSEAFDYLDQIKPKIVIPVHDGFIKEPSLFDRIVGMQAEQKGYKFIGLEYNKSVEV